MTTYHYDDENTYLTQVNIWGPRGATQYWGSYYDVDVHPNAGATAANVVPITLVYTQNDVSIVNNNILIEHVNTYRVSYSLQFLNVNNVEQFVDVWVVKNGQAISDSNSSFGITPRQGQIDGRTIAVSDFILDCVAGDTIGFRWHSNSTNVSLETIPAGTNPTRPRTPSVIINIASL